ncbi:hypothetical protein LAZ67_15000402 [Cordylochernes scorpioides]|uniref:Transposase n=1 Tax=Cordylochernes scorpioides TaxID=51811 RepID=A0ABY6L963_9ARAC|nr:hypothetical protein LAZ67_15000402 [Cordylochernes scorpioides]
MIVRQIKETLGIPKTTVDRIMREHLGLRNLSARWVPKLLTPDQKAVRRKLSSDNLALLEARVQRNLLIDLLPWMRLGPITLHQSPSNNPCNGDTPVPLSPRKPRHFDKQGRKFVYHQDNAPSHRSLQAMAAIHDSGFELLPHTPYSPDLAPSDFHLFPRLKNHFLAFILGQMKRPTPPSETGRARMRPGSHETRFVPHSKRPSGACSRPMMVSGSHVKAAMYPTLERQAVSLGPDSKNTNLLGSMQRKGLPWWSMVSVRDISQIGKMLPYLQGHPELTPEEVPGGHSINEGTS